MQVLIPLCFFLPLCEHSLSPVEHSMAYAQVWAARNTFLSLTSVVWTVLGYGRRQTKA